MRNLILPLTGHLGIRFAFVLETRVPSYNAFVSNSETLTQQGFEKAAFVHSPKCVGPLASTILPYSHINQSTI